MAKKAQKAPEAEAAREAVASEVNEAQPSEAATGPAAIGLPKFNPHRRPSGSSEAVVEHQPVHQSYESVQQEARGPGVDEWRRVDKARADLNAYYRSLSEDERYSPEYKSQAGWERYEQTKAQVEKLAPEARRKMLSSAASLERMSFPTPEGEALVTKDTDKLLLTAHERARLESLVNHRVNAAKGPFKASPVDILKSEYERGLSEGGPGGGSTVRAVLGLLRDWGLDTDSVVDAHRKPHHHGALADAQAARQRADMVGTRVPQPPASLQAKPGASKASPTGTPKAYSIPRERHQIFKKKPSWK
jgi:hypothetical protein